MGSYDFQQRRNVGQAVDLIVCSNLRMRRSVVRVEPAGLHPGVDAAENVAGRAVSDQNRLLRFKIRDLGKAAIKEFPARLICADQLGDKDPLEIRRDIGALESPLLHDSVAVGNKIEQIIAVEILQKLLRTGDEIMPLTQIRLIDLLRLLRIAVRADFGKQLAKPPGQNLRSFNLAALQHSPMRRVDLTVSLNEAVRRLDAEAEKGFAHSLSLGAVKVQDRIIQIQ